MKALNFSLIGAAGYVAPRHMRAISDNGHQLRALYDPNDSVGIVDKYFPYAEYFNEFERYDRHVDKLKRAGDDQRIHFTSICSPNYLHDSHIRHALKSGANVICEKPLVLNPWNMVGLHEISKEHGLTINCILQLRLHKSVVQLKKKLEQKTVDQKYDVRLTYVTARGAWYKRSWKGNVEKSGGVTSNIGIHFFDLLIHIFGGALKSSVNLLTPEKASGFLELENARVSWFLSIDESDIPEHIRMNDGRTFRSIEINGKEFEFSDGFDDLHTESYKQILAGNGFGLEESKAAVEVVSEIRNAELTFDGEIHPMAPQNVR